MSNCNQARVPEGQKDRCVLAAGRAPSCWLREPDGDDLHDIAAWLAQPDLNQWFDFGLGRQTLPLLAIQSMARSGRHRIRVFGAMGHHTPSGLAAVSDITHAFGTGSFWVLRDARRPACRDMTLLASTRVLHDAFMTDRLQCITAWAVDCNVRSRRLLERIGFRPAGQQRNCHVMQGSRFGRVLYDLLPGDLALATGTPAGVP